MTPLLRASVSLRQAHLPSHLALASAVAACIALLGCDRASPPSAAGPIATPKPDRLPADDLTAPAPPCADVPLRDEEKLRAGQLVQQLLRPSHGPVAVSSLALVSGLVRVVVTPATVGAKAFDVFLSRDLRLLVPRVEPVAAQLERGDEDQALDRCLRASGLRLYGDPQQPETRRQLAELGAAAQLALVNCRAAPGDCAKLGQTSLPVLMFGAQRITSFVPRKVIAEWTKCGQP